MLTTTWQVGAPDSTNTDVYSTTAFTPGTNQLIVVIALVTGSVADLTCTDNRGGTYDSVRTEQKGSGNDRVVAFVRTTKTASALSHTITVTSPGDNGTGTIIGVWSIDGAASSGSSAVRQHQGASNQTAGTSPSFTFGEPVSSRSTLIGMLVNASNPVGSGVPAGWEADAAVSYDTPNSGATLGHCDGGFSGSTLSFASSSSLWGAIVLELDGRTPPGAPTAVSGIPLDEEVKVSWDVPTEDGGSPITDYTVTASPGGATATVDASFTQATVAGLTNGVSYTFTVVATNAMGNSVASLASPAVTPDDGLSEPLPDPVWKETHIVGPALRVNLLGQFLGRDSEGDPIFGSVSVSSLSAPQPFDPSDFLPLPASVAVVLTTRTNAEITITPAENPWPRSPVDHYEVWRSENGGAFTHIADLDADETLFINSSLPTATPEILFRWYVRAVNADGTGPQSNTTSAQWSNTATQQPTAPFNLTVSEIGADSVRLSWQVSPDPTVTKYGIFNGTTLLVDNIDPGALTYVWEGLTPVTVYNNISLRRFNGSGIGFLPGWSVASNFVTFTTSFETPDPLHLGHVPGKIYLGWSTNHDEGSGSGTAEHQLNTLTPKPADAPASYSDLLGVRRLYNKVTSVINWADAQNRVLWISAKPNELGVNTMGLSFKQQCDQIASGARDSSIRSYFSSLVARNKLTVFTYYHEPIGDADLTADAISFVNAFQRIMQVVDAEWPGHRILFCPNYEENRLRNVKNGQPGQIDWALWLPEHICPGKGGDRPFDFISFDIYQYNANTSNNAKQGVQFSHRWWKIDEMFAGVSRPTGSSVMPWMDYTPGLDLTYGIGECSPRAGAFYMYQNPSFVDHEEDGDVLPSRPSNMTGAKYARDMWDYIFANVDKFWMVSTFNSIGAGLCYNDERLYPGANSWGGKTPVPGSLHVQTGDTELTINIYREKLAGGKTVKLSASGLPA